MLSKNDTLSLKGIAILVVMFGHLVTVNYTTFHAELRWTASFGVTIFLLISGYGLVRSFDASGLRGFFNKRFTTVYIPFSIATVAVALLNGSHFSNLRDVIKTLTFTNLNMNIDPTLWYIYFITIWYALFYLSFRFINNIISRQLILYTAAIFFVCTTPFGSHENLAFQTKLHAFSFPIGVTLSYLSIGKRQCMILGAAFLILCVATQAWQWIEYFDFKFSLSCLFFGLAVIALISATQCNSKALCFFGAYSYEIYLFEGVMLRYRFSDNLITNAIVFLLITTAIAFAFKRVHTYVTFICMDILNKYTPKSGKLFWR